VSIERDKQNKKLMQVVKSERIKKPRALYDCEKCPAYCCSVYERVAVSDSDLVRLALHFRLSVEEAEKQLTKKWEDERILKRQKDPVLGSACRYLDLNTRGCTIYDARPDTCRDYPVRKRCAYYDLYRFEMEQQDDKTVLPLIQIEFRNWKGENEE
jgi:Fe-S-cluster containining protein